MKKNLLLLIAFLGMAILTQAEPVNPERAASIAQGHLRSAGTRQAAPGLSQKPTLAFAATAKDNVTVDYYVFNNSGEDYFGDVNYIVWKNGAEIYGEPGQRLQIATGTEVISKAVVGAPEETGEYQLEMIDVNGDRVGELYNFTVTGSTDFSLNIKKDITPTSYYMTSGNVTASAQITNSGTGEYVGTIPFMIANKELSRVLTTGESDVLTIAPGETATVNFKSAFEGVDGISYYIALRTIIRPKNNVEWGTHAPFQIKNDQSGVNDINADTIQVVSGHGFITVSGAENVAVYNTVGMLMGTGNDHRLPAGIYIVVADGTTHKVAVR